MVDISGLTWLEKRLGIESTAAQLFFCKIEQTLFFKVEKSSTLTTAW